MKLPSLEDWRDFLEMLREQGATGVAVTLAPDGEVTGLRCDLHRVTKTGDAKGKAPEDKGPDLPPLPAGLGGIL